MIALIASCKKENTVDNATKPVVIGYLIPGQSISLRVYSQKGLSDTATYGTPITGLTPSVSDGSKTVQLTDSGNGIYTYNDLSFVSSGKTYQLKFTYNSLPVTATTSVPSKPVGFTASKTLINLPTGSTISPQATDSIAVTFKWKNPDSLYHVIVFKNDDSSPFNIHPQFNAAVNFTINAKKAEYYNVYYRTFNYIGIYRAILWSVSEDYINMLKTNANTSSQRLTDAPTNIINGYGIFSGMQSDTIKLQLTQY
ncbi:DUF4249 domain-containing protein [Mucilaginibacter sp. RS28]|uniref:DUF4249 domain-containing protein n=1 Tax=Mucilaginibacter straminoryzae TaxID=2932774 RepID=A0A9X1X2E5_9SPHI|nr:DUF4249 family protein [Mucilaginibacter straminoryzae]MCJ8209606.1 DUF4249 domain-containing protein [Mucilaginibacter straminoryzae]